MRQMTTTESPEGPRALSTIFQYSMHIRAAVVWTALMETADDMTKRSRMVSMSHDDDVSKLVGRVDDDAGWSGNGNHVD